jgi:tetraacyldisaccharide 4'-kinase
VLDDGFQHRRLARDCDVLLLAAHDPFGGGRGLPAGLLRERIVPALDRAHLIVVSSHPSPHAPDLERVLARWTGHLPLFRERHEPTALLGLGREDIQPPTALAGRRVFAVAGLARPVALRDSLAGLGAEIVGYRDLPDHHRFRPGEVEALHRLARDVGAELIVTTEKDAVRWPVTTPGDPPVTVLRVEARLDDPAGFLREVERRLERAASWTASRPPV